MHEYDPIGAAHRTQYRKLFRPATQWTVETARQAMPPMPPPHHPSPPPVRHPFTFPVWPEKEPYDTILKNPPLIRGYGLVNRFSLNPDMMMRLASVPGLLVYIPLPDWHDECYDQLPNLEMATNRYNTSESCSVPPTPDWDRTVHVEKLCLPAVFAPNEDEQLPPLFVTDATDD